jgi:hypothetical protein
MQSKLQKDFGGFEFAGFINGCNLSRPITVFSGKFPRFAVIMRLGAALTKQPNKKT